jgi:predicted tellurium resistance membrane protein TerC
MITDIILYIVLAVSFLPFIFFAYLNSKANVKKENRNRQFIMPVFAVVFSILGVVFMDTVSAFLLPKVSMLAGLFDGFLPIIGFSVYLQTGAFFKPSGFSCHGIFGHAGAIILISLI